MSHKTLSDRIVAFQPGKSFDNDELWQFYNELSEVSTVLEGKGPIFMSTSKLVLNTQNRVKDIITARGI